MTQFCKTNKLPRYDCSNFFYDMTRMKNRQELWKNLLKQQRDKKDVGRNEV